MTDRQIRYYRYNREIQPPQGNLSGGFSFPESRGARLTPHLPLSADIQCAGVICRCRGIPIRGPGLTVSGRIVTPLDLDWYAARLAIAVHDINAEQQMSIQAVREALKHLPGGSTMTMRYGNGGRTQIFKIGDEEVELGPEATASDIEAALELKKKDQRSAIQFQQLKRSQA